MISRKFVLVAVLAACSMSAMAQEFNDKLFNHMAVGVDVGTTGWGIDVAAPIGRYVQVRAGISSMPDISFSNDIDISISDEQRKAYVLHKLEGSVLSEFIDPELLVNYIAKYQDVLDLDEVNVEGTLGFTHGKILFDVYPFRQSSFHITAGAYIGTDKVFKVKNTNAELAMAGFYEFNKYASKYGVPKIGATLGDYLLTPTQNGVIDAYAKVSGFKPYVGVGFGRAVQHNHRFGVSFDFGCMFWNSPEIYCNSADGYLKLNDSNASGKAGGIIKSISDVSVYPVLNLRLCYRLF